MRWKRGHVSKDVEDRRGRPAGKRGVALGGVGLAIAAIAILLNGGGIKELLGLASSSGSSATTTSSDPPSAEQDELFQFISSQLDDQQDTWAAIFKTKGKRYQRATLVVFNDGVKSACGTQGKEVGPFYCPADQKAYIDLSFYKQLAGLGGPGDFAQAYVLAHEIGHHVQTITGTADKVRRLKSRNRAGANALSVRSELQADCYAGVWAHSAAERNKLEMGDLEEGLKAAAAIGDDTLQGRGG
ncbi:MAG: neutral zinc metallopeptidase, partial [Kofleriaceae bacterium]|nr:neutral zinc metallopeptidase [Kofleriaceae bacterium]